MISTRPAQNRVSGLAAGCGSVRSEDGTREPVLSAAQAGPGAESARSPACCIGPVCHLFTPCDAVLAVREWAAAAVLTSLACLLTTKGHFVAVLSSLSRESGNGTEQQHGNS